MQGLAREVWDATVASMPVDRHLTRADLFVLEGACRNFARYQRIETQIEDLSAKSALAGDFAKGKEGRLEVSVLRQQANDAFAEFKRLSRDLGVSMTAGGERVDRDLFGDPVVLPNGKRGRPKHRPSQKLRDKVLMLLALGWRNERIANAIGVTQPTLRKHYGSELKLRQIQRDRLDAWRFEKVVHQAEAGNVGALRLLQQMLEKNDAMEASASLTGDQERGEKTEKLGKKEAANRAAERAIAGDDAGEWGSDLSPGFKH
ncbi:MAG: hypothetical protein CMH12_03290 [Maritimibacter sp.]|nr:hypothetical protein [Maritimibacter sp.]